MIIIKSKKCSLEKIHSEYPNCIIIDVTSKAQNEFIRLSPFYPVMDIPVPGLALTSASVEGIWQGLKVFENEGVCLDSFRNKTMKGLKRTCRVHGLCKGHKYGNELLGYIEARQKIYVPSYNWVLKHKCSDLVKKIKVMSNSRDVILLDYDTNDDILNTSSPLSHASLIKKYIENS